MLGLVMLLSLTLGLMQPAQAATQNAVLTWPDLSNETGYVIERKVGPSGTYAQVGTTLAGVVTYTDVNLAQGTNFCWRVFGVNALGNGVPSDDVCITTVGVPNKVGPVTITIQIVP
jgi:hypothetical protein